MKQAKMEIGKETSRLSQRPGEYIVTTPWGFMKSEVTKVIHNITEHTPQLISQETMRPGMDTDVMRWKVVMEPGYKGEDLNYKSFNIASKNQAPITIKCTLATSKARDVHLSTARPWQPKYGIKKKKDPPAGMTNDPNCKKCKARLLTGDHSCGPPFRAYCYSCGKTNKDKVSQAPELGALQEMQEEEGKEKESKKRGRQSESLERERMAPNDFLRDVMDRSEQPASQELASQKVFTPKPLRKSKSDEEMRYSSPMNMGAGRRSEKSPERSPDARLGAQRPGERQESQESF